MFLLKDVKYKNILDIAYLEIKENKLTCIVGESGSGKSTLLRLLNKLISCDSGEIFYKGENLKDIDSVSLRRKVVMLSQFPSIFNGAVKDNLLIGLKFSEKDEVDDEKLREVLRLVNLNKELNDGVDNLSGGEKQRLALARVILMDPEVFLLDEPSSALDEETEEIIIEKLVAYTKGKRKILVMVTHSKKVADTYGENIIEIHQGKVLSCKEV
ncbi:MAG: ATP-binding cassette domain-containing protein [Finegoldia sp.]|nr:ATP-binding cassette domain-containing protein [Finegoldia sp.]